jgi:hypothetical protein
MTVAPATRNYDNQTRYLSVQAILVRSVHIARELELIEIKPEELPKTCLKFPDVAFDGRTASGGLRGTRFIPLGATELRQLLCCTRQQEPGTNQLLVGSPGRGVE